MRAIWKGETIAESDQTVVMDGAHYFPRVAVREDAIMDSPTRTMHTSKGEAWHYTVIVDGHENPDAAWYYPQPSAEAEAIRDHIAFGRGVDVVE